MRSLARYAVTNAVTRAMVSNLLTKQDFDVLLRASSVQETWNALRRTAWADDLPEDARLDPLSIEKHLRESTALRFKRSIRMLSGRPEGVGALLLSRWELENLEFALRLWHGKDPSLEDYLSYPLFVHEIPVVDIIRAQTIDEVALALRHTPYLEPLSVSAARYRERHSIFYVEVALEKDYYRRLLAAVRALGGMDAREGERIVGAEIDMVNLSWLSRLLQYYEVPASGLGEFVIIGPSALSRQLATPSLAASALDEWSARFLGDRLGKEGRGLSRLEQVSLLEHLVSEMAVAEARALLARYPFSIACVFSFYLLKRVELGNLCTVFAGKAGGLSESDIAARLHGLE